ncbi:hypothetical protein QQ045_021532 [Rhodiola kirilowii]
MYARRSAVTNTLIRLGTVEGYFVKRALAAFIRPLSHQQRRSSGFQPRPTRLSAKTSTNQGLPLPFTQNDSINEIPP